MTKPPELWAFVLANSGMFIISTILAVLTYTAYRQSEESSSYLIATAGFGWSFWGLVEPVYQLGVRGDFNVNGTEFLWLQAGDGVLIAAGLALLFCAITRHGSRSATADERTYKFGPRDDGSTSPSWSED